MSRQTRRDQSGEREKRRQTQRNRQLGDGHRPKLKQGQTDRQRQQRERERNRVERGIESIDSGEQLRETEKKTDRDRESVRGRGAVSSTFGHGS